MINLGLAGPAGCGKDTVADHLVRRYGFLKYSFSDALYREVTEAFGLEDDSLLRQRETKELRDHRLALYKCLDTKFFMRMVEHENIADIECPRSPRQILQWWGTEYRRAQDPDYWVKRADEWIYDVMATVGYPELRPQFFVNTSVRFPNEQEWIHKFTCGNVWHIRREELAPVNVHESETPLPVLERERELWNNDTIDRLYNGIDLLLRTNSRFVRVEPMLPVVQHEVEPPEKEFVGSTGQYYRVQADGHRMLCNADGTRSIFDDVDDDGTDPGDTRTEDQVAAEVNYAKGH